MKPSDKALLLVLDSVGVGHARDAAAYGDEGANTIKHLFPEGPAADLPALTSLGLGEITGFLQPSAPRAAYGRMAEASAGKCTTTGHWELAGVILDKPFAVFRTIPQPLVEAIEDEAGTRFLGNIAASGTEILDQLGSEHLATGFPILYTSADSVLQIAAHESLWPRERLYALCRIARKFADRFQIARVIARPFEGNPGRFRRTANRHDFSMPPPPNILDTLSAQGIPVTAIGKISDIFAERGFADSWLTASNAQGMEAVASWWSRSTRGLCFANLVDFDTLYGHRRDPVGYRHALAEFDRWLAGFLPRIFPGDLAIITADHGNDPTWHGTDHTREQVPVFVLHRTKAGPLGLRETFADVAATLAAFFGLPAPAAGLSMLP